MGGNKKLIYTFSINHHEILDIWTVREHVSAMDCIREYTDKILAIGTCNGNVFIRKNWEEIELCEKFPRNDEIIPHSKIINLKFSFCGTQLLVAAVENTNKYVIYCFKKVNNKYFSTKP